MRRAIFILAVVGIVSVVFVVISREPSEYYDLVGARLYGSVDNLATEYKREFDGFSEEFSKSSTFVLPHDTIDIAALSGFYSTFASQVDIGSGTIVVVGPDHRWDAESPIVTTSRKWRTSFGGVRSDDALIEYLLERGVVTEQEELFKYEHSTYIHVPLIAKFFPDARIVPLVVSPRSGPFNIVRVSDALSQYSDAPIFMFASVDFYHGSDTLGAYRDDITSWRTLSDTDTYAVSRAIVDSPMSLFMAKYFANLKEDTKYIQFLRTSSDEGNGNEFTTHHYGAFTTALVGSLPQPPVEILIGGDVVLDEHFEKVGLKYNIFEVVSQLAEGAGLFVFNNEGVLLSDKDHESNATVPLVLSREMLSGFRSAISGVAIAGLANNHSLDFGPEGMSETILNLQELGYEVFGDEFGSTKITEPYFSTVSGRAIALYGYNQFGGDEEEVLTALNANSARGQLDIVFTHWGVEYRGESNLVQRNLARRFISAGADVVIGHHPHVVQEYERIDDGIVFYSLGNFIHDQTFNEAVMSGLVLNVFVGDEDVAFVPIPISNKNGKMRIESSEMFLQPELFPSYKERNVIMLKGY